MWWVIVAITLLVLIITKHFYNMYDGQRHAGNKTYTTLYRQKICYSIGLTKEHLLQPNIPDFMPYNWPGFFNYTFGNTADECPQFEASNCGEWNKNSPRCIWYPGITAQSLKWGEGWWHPLSNTFLSSGDQDMGASNSSSYLESEHLDYWYPII